MLEIIIAVGAVALVAFTIIINIVRKRKGKSSCGCDCKPDTTSSSGGCLGGCSGCPRSCSKRKE